MKNKSEAGAPLPENVRAAIEHVIDYLWDDERSDFESQAASDRDGHVFESLRDIQAWLNGEQATPVLAMKPVSVRGEGWSL